MPMHVPMVFVSNFAVEFYPMLEDLFSSFQIWFIFNVAKTIFSVFKWGLKNISFSLYFYKALEDMKVYPILNCYCLFSVISNYD